MCSQQNTAESLSCVCTWGGGLFSDSFFFFFQTGRLHVHTHTQTQKGIFIARKKRGKKIPVRTAWFSFYRSLKTTNYFAFHRIVNGRFMSSLNSHCLGDLSSLIENVKNKKRRRRKEDISSCMLLCLAYFEGSPFFKSSGERKVRRADRLRFFNGFLLPLRSFRTRDVGAESYVLLPAKEIKILSCSRLLSVNGTFRS